MATLSNYQFSLLDATLRSQTTLGSKQTADAQSSIMANNLLALEYQEANYVLQGDTITVQEQHGNNNALTVANQVYQNDSSVAQT